MISVVIPAYNEEQRIGSTVKKIAAYFEGQDVEIIVVSDGSKDKTKEVVEDLKLKRVKVIEYSPNRGKGYAVKTGVMAAKGEYILMSDADLSTPIEQFAKFKSYMSHGDVIIGSRALRRSLITKHQPWYRELIGKIFNKIVRVLAVRGIHDTQCGFKFFSRKAAMDIFPKLTIDGFGFDVEALMLARKLGYEIKELPVVWENDERSKVSPIKHSVKMFFEVMKIRWNMVTGKYAARTQ
jgi:dolichyl-phosphate beta-glucosyltransferase